MSGKNHHRRAHSEIRVYVFGDVLHQNTWIAQVSTVALQLADEGIHVLTGGADLKRYIVFEGTESPRYEAMLIEKMFGPEVNYVLEHTPAQRINVVSFEFDGEQVTHDLE